MSHSSTKLLLIQEAYRALKEGGLESLKFIMLLLKNDFGISRIGYLARIGSDGFRVVAWIGERPLQLGSIYDLEHDIDLEKLEKSGFLVTDDQEHTFDLYQAFITNSHLVGVMVFDDLDGRQEYKKKIQANMFEINKFLQDLALSNISELAFIDPSTNLYTLDYLVHNRRSFDSYHTIIAISLEDNTTKVNLAGGQAVDREFAKISHRLFREEDIIIRLKDRRFLVILQNSADDKDISLKLDLLKSELEKAWHWPHRTGDILFNYVVHQRPASSLLTIEVEKAISKL